MEVEPFDASMIRAAFASLKYKYRSDAGDGNSFTLRFTSEHHDGGLLIRVLVISDLVRIALFGDSLEQGQWAHALMACNQWNAEQVTGKAYLQVDKEGSSGAIVIEELADFDHGVHAEFLASWVKRSIDGILQCASWLRTEKEL